MAVLIAKTTRATSDTARPLGARLAAFSYTLYLSHFPLLLVMRSWHTPYATVSAESILTYFAKIAVCLAAAWVLYLPFERNTARFRRLLRARSATDIVPSPCGKS